MLTCPVSGGGQDADVGDMAVRASQAGKQRHVDPGSGADLKDVMAGTHL